MKDMAWHRRKHPVGGASSGELWRQRMKSPLDMCALLIKIFGLNINFKTLHYSVTVPLPRRSVTIFTVIPLQNSSSKDSLHFLKKFQQGAFHKLGRVRRRKRSKLAVLNGGEREQVFFFYFYGKQKREAKTN